MNCSEILRIAEEFSKLRREMCLCSLEAVTLATSAPADSPNSKTNTETARTGDLVLDNNLILLDSEIPKPHKDPNFDQIAAFSEISPAVASVHMRSRSYSRG